MAFETETEQAILTYAPYYRQHNAALFGEHRDYIDIVIQLYRDWHNELNTTGATEWADMPTARKQYIDDNKPY